MMNLKNMLVAVLLVVALATAHAQPMTPQDVIGVRDAVGAYDAKNFSEAMRRLRPFADRGSAEAQYYIGRMHEKGEGVPKDMKQAVSWYRASAENGYARSQYRLAVGYAFGMGGLPSDNAKATQWLQKAAQGGDRRAQKVLSRAYADGQFGLSQDSVKAAYWAKQAETSR